MDGSPPDTLYLQERRRRLAAERTLDRTRHELSRAHSALVANADRLSLRYLSERETNLRLTDRQKKVLADRKEAADKADRARRRLWHALEAMRDGFALFDGDGRLVAANSVYLNLFDCASDIGPGAAAEEMFTIAAEEGAFAIDDEDPDDWVAAQVARWDAETIPAQVLQTYDGRSIRFQDRRAPDGDIVSLAVDVSDTLAREESLAAARDAAEDVARAKQAFLARMSHEIRTPMNGVLGLSEMLCDQDIDDEAKSYARTIRESAEALLVIVNDTLDVSQLEADAVELRHETFDLEAMLVDCIRLTTAGRDTSDIDLAMDYPLTAPVQFAGDPGRVRQIVMNLLGNATKFTDAGHVVIRVDVAGHGPEAEVTVEVEDTGPGIPNDMRDAIFDAFTQVENGRPQKEGTGLGLTISRGLAVRMGGDLSIVDGAGDGACFRLVLPLEAEAAPAPRTDLPQRIIVPDGTGVQGDVIARRLSDLGPSVSRGAGGGDVTVLPLTRGRPVPDTTGPLILLGDRAVAPAEVVARAGAVLPLPVRATDLMSALVAPPTDAAPKPSAPSQPVILVADDNATNRFLLERMLINEPYDICMVEDGSQALEACRKAMPALILMDISMPVMDGFEATTAIRDLASSQGRTPPPIIALTAHTGAEMTGRLEESGFVAHQEKPVRKPALLSAMAEALGRPAP